MVCYFCAQDVLADSFLHEKPAVRRRFPPDVRSNFGLPVIPLPLRALGHHHWQPHEGFGPVPRRSGDIHVRVFYALRGPQPTVQKPDARRGQKREIASSFLSWLQHDIR